MPKHPRANLGLTGLALRRVRVGSLLGRLPGPRRVPAGSPPGPRRVPNGSPPGPRRARDPKRPEKDPKKTQKRPKKDPKKTQKQNSKKEEESPKKTQQRPEKRPHRHPTQFLRDSCAQGLNLELWRTSLRRLTCLENRSWRSPRDSLFSLLRKQVRKLGFFCGLVLKKHRVCRVCLLHATRILVDPRIIKFILLMLGAQCTPAWMFAVKFGEIVLPQFIYQSRFQK